MQRLKPHLKRIVFNLLKFGVSLGIVVWLVIGACRDQAFAQLSQQPKDWPLLALAAGAGLGAVLLTFVRWLVLVRALDLPFTLKDALRLGFLGYLLNFVSLGAVGGDLFKAVFVARQFPGRRPEAVATVVLDRVVGLYMLFVMASVAILATGQLHNSDETVRIIGRGALLASMLGAAGILVMLIPGVTQGSFSSLLNRLPKVGPTFGKLLGAIRIYRSRPGVLVLSALISVGVHSLSTLSVYLVARGLPGECPSLADHFVMVPLAFVTGVLPLPVNGLGAFEMVVKMLYERVPLDIHVAEGQGFVVSLGYRAVTILIALIGVCYYLASRREVAKVLAEAEREMDEEGEQPAAGSPDLCTSELRVSNC
ncbi:MAG TPA: lysylphosphatidylglycerol synthase transmembrane domain-containing protein [Pirellulales bacterium]|nr:lysylphosphatidylglycerol synthase transmembrane domain-containing protein [Pirellulales bacterium]